MEGGLNSQGALSMAHSVVGWDCGLVLGPCCLGWYKGLSPGSATTAESIQVI